MQLRLMSAQILDYLLSVHATSPEQLIEEFNSRRLLAGDAPSMHPALVPEAAEIGGGEADREVGFALVVAAAEDFAVAVDPGQGAAVGERHVEPHRLHPAVEPVV